MHQLHIDEVKVLVIDEFTALIGISVWSVLPSILVRPNRVENQKHLFILTNFIISEVDANVSIGKQGINSMSYSPLCCQL